MGYEIVRGYSIGTGFDTSMSSFMACIVQEILIFEGARQSPEMKMFLSYIRK